MNLRMSDNELYRNLLAVFESRNRTVLGDFGLTVHQSHLRLLNHLLGRPLAIERGDCRLDVGTGSVGVPLFTAGCFDFTHGLGGEVYLSDNTDLWRFGDAGIRIFDCWVANHEVHAVGTVIFKEVLSVQFVSALHVERDSDQPIELEEVEEKEGDFDIPFDAHLTDFIDDEWRSMFEGYRTVAHGAMLDLVDVVVLEIWHDTNNVETVADDVGGEWVGRLGDGVAVPNVITVAFWVSLTGVGVWCRAVNGWRVPSRFSPSSGRPSMFFRVGRSHP